MRRVTALAAVSWLALGVLAILAVAFWDAIG
jgi:hypothetical protein